MNRLLSLLLVAALLPATIISAQSIVTVNNTPGETATYRTLQGAVDSVADGTIILLQPGPFSYGNVIIRKRVSIMGAGYFLGLNPEPSTQASLQSSITGWIAFEAGSNGSQIMGLSLTGDGTGQTRDRINCSQTGNITVSRCLIYPYNGTSSILSGYQSGGIRVQQCHIKMPGAWGHGRILWSRESTGFEFSNSIFENDGYPTYGFYLPTEHFTNYTASVLFKNNVMFHINNPGYYPSTNTFINNIIYQVNNTPVDCITADRNIGNAQFTAGGGTNMNALINDVFILNTGGISYGPDGKYQLKAGSPAIGFGQGGIDCGAFGGSNSYVLSGIPVIPNVYSSVVQGIPTTTDGLRLHLKVKANQ